MNKLIYAAAAAVALTATQASAVTTVTITGISLGANLIGGVSVTTPAINHGAVYINQFHYSGYYTAATTTLFNADTNCVDLEHYVANGDYTLASITTRVPDLTKRRQLLTFIGRTTPLVAGATTADAKNIAAAAMQLGIWEILYETGTTGYNVAAGNFSSQNGWNAAAFASAQTMANGWLGQTTSGAWTPVAGKTLGYLYNPGLQSQVYLRDLGQGEQSLIGNVPEPSEWALLLAGFGVAGWAARRRKTRVAVSYA